MARVVALATVEFILDRYVAELWLCPSPNRPLANGCNWPSTTFERPPSDVGDAIHSRRRSPRRPLCDTKPALLTRAWPALDDPDPRIVLPS